MKSAVKEHYSLWKTMTVNWNACFQQWPLGWEFEIQNVELVVHCLVLLARGWKGGRDGRSAYAVCFAYGRSLVKTIADEKTITIMRSALQRKTFIRFSVLENTGIKGSSGKWTKLHWQWGMPSFEMLHFLHTEIQQGSIKDEFGIPWCQNFM